MLGSLRSQHSAINLCGEKNPCENADGYKFYLTSKELENNLYNITDDVRELKNERIIAIGSDIDDKNALKYYGKLSIDGPDAVRKMSTGFTNGDKGTTFTLTTNVIAPAGYYGNSIPEPDYFCTGEKVQAHWIDYPVNSTGFREKVEMKLKFIDYADE